MFQTTEYLWPVSHQPIDDPVGFKTISARHLGIKGAHPQGSLHFAMDQMVHTSAVLAAEALALCNDNTFKCFIELHPYLALNWWNMRFGPHCPLPIQLWKLWQKTAQSYPPPQPTELPKLVPRLPPQYMPPLPPLTMTVPVPAPMVPAPLFPNGSEVVYAPASTQNTPLYGPDICLIPPEVHADLCLNPDCTAALLGLDNVSPSDWIRWP